MKGPELLKHYEDNWVTDMGAWFPGERVVLRGKDVFTELNNHTWMEYLVYSITGRESSKLARLVEAIWSLSTSYPDPRLWNNRVAALAGTTRSTGSLAVAAGSAVSEATTYGLRTSKGAIDFLFRAEKKLNRGVFLEDIVKEELKQYRVLYGFGRPITNHDERVAPLMEFAKSIGAGSGNFVRLAFAIEDYLKSTRYPFRINISAVAAGLLADEGVTVEQFYNLANLSFVGGLVPCFIDASTKAEGVFFPITAGKINNVGRHELRRWRS